MSLNKVMLIGHVGNAVTTRQSPKGLTICSFSVATNQFTGKKDGKAEQRTDWHRIEVYGRQAVACTQYLKSGSKVFIEGSLFCRTYRDRDGEEKRVVKVLCSYISFLELSKPDSRKAKLLAARLQPATATEDSKT